MTNTSSSSSTFDPNGYLLLQKFKRRKGYDPKNVDHVLQFSGSNYKRKNVFQRFWAHLILQRYFWSLHSAIYFMDDAEAIVCLLLIILIIVTCGYASYYYLPLYTPYCSKKLIEYFPLLTTWTNHGRNL
jgi:hypothetical protein